jgi:hypothetical protein
MSRRHALFVLIVVSSLLGGARTARADVDVDLVTDWFKTYLHRVPDESTLSAYVSELKRGVQPSTVKAQILGSEEYYERHRRNPDSFVTALFRDLRDRGPSPAELRSWMDELARLGGDRQELALRFVRATLRPEQPWLKTADLDTIRNWYRRYLNRPPDSAEVNQWVQKLEQGWSMLDVQAGILGSEEFFRRHDRDPARFITALYTEVAGMPPRPDDVRYWLSWLQQANGDRQAVARRSIAALRLQLQPNPTIPARMPDVVERMAAETRQARLDGELELAGTAQGRQVSLRTNALVDYGQRLRELLQQRGYTTDQVRDALDRVEEADNAVAAALAEPPGTAPHCLAAAQRVANLVAAARATLPTPAPAPVLTTPPRVTTTVMAFDTERALRLMRPVLRDNQEVVHLLRSLPDQNSAFQGLARDADVFTAQLDSFRAQLRLGDPLPALQTSFQALRRQERRIGQVLAAITAPGTLRNAWWQVEQDLAPVTAALGLGPEVPAPPKEAVLTTRPDLTNLTQPKPGPAARPTTVVGQADAAATEVDAFLATLNPFVLANPAVPRLQVAARNLRNDLVRLRQSAAGGAQQDLAGRYVDVSRSFEQARRQWEAAARTLPPAEATQWARVQQAVEPLRPPGAERRAP